MNLKENENIKNNIAVLKDNILSYIQRGGDYTEKEVDECLAILNSYLEKMQQANSKEQGMKIVEKTILALNDLNERCECELIETGERELIAEIVIEAGHLMGYNEMHDDITEEWRDW